MKNKIDKLKQNFLKLTPNIKDLKLVVKEESGYNYRAQAQIHLPKSRYLFIEARANSAASCLSSLYQSGKKLLKKEKSKLLRRRKLSRQRLRLQIE